MVLKTIFIILSSAALHAAQVGQHAAGAAQVPGVYNVAQLTQFLQQGNVRLQDIVNLSDRAGRTLASQLLHNHDFRYPQDVDRLRLFAHLVANGADMQTRAVQERLGGYFMEIAFSTNPIQAAENIIAIETRFSAQLDQLQQSRDGEIRSALVPFQNPQAPQGRGAAAPTNKPQKAWMRGEIFLATSMAVAGLYFLRNWYLKKSEEKKKSQQPQIARVQSAFDEGS